MATTIDDVVRLIGELAEAQKETERRYKAMPIARGSSSWPNLAIAW
jgi:hypothetical protein